MPQHPPADRLRPTLPLALALLTLIVYRSAGELFLNGFTLDLGHSLNAPAPMFGRFLGMWMAFGSVAAIFLAISLARWVDARKNTDSLVAMWTAATDGKWLLYGSLFAFLIPAALRTYLLNGAPLTDDESAYRFMAQLLAAGQLYADSPPLKLFFDNRFMINDGKLYAHYFVGWPALMAPGVWLGATGWMNAVYSALTVPPLFLILRRLLGSAWARVGVVLYLVSPMLAVAAATETAHTSCVAALAWFTWLSLRCRDEGAPWWLHSAAALAFCAAFFNRPTSALGIGLPLLLAWLLGLRALSHRRRAAALLAFGLPAIVLAALFLAVNHAQNGAPFAVAYQRAYTYAAENDFRFSLWPHEIEGGAMTELRFDSLGRSLGVLGVALFRLNVTMMGWPVSLLFVFFAGWKKELRFLWLMAASYLLLHFFTDNVGIDTFAPMHFFELAWPLLLLSVAGLAALTTAARRLPIATATTFPLALATAMVIVALTGYVPVRLAAIHSIAENIRLPRQTLAEAGIDRAVLFTGEPFIRYCRSTPTLGWVFARPNNDPWLQDDLLWVNHLSVETDRLLMREVFPDREGYLMQWVEGCQVVFLPLAQLAPDAVPDAPISGIDEITVSTKSGVDEIPALTGRSR